MVKRLLVVVFDKIVFVLTTRLSCVIDVMEPFVALTVIEVMVVDNIDGDVILVETIIFDKTAEDPVILVNRRLVVVVLTVLTFVVSKEFVVILDTTISVALTRLITFRDDDDIFVVIILVLVMDVVKRLLEVK